MSKVKKESEAVFYRRLWIKADREIKQLKKRIVELEAELDRLRQTDRQAHT